MLYWEGIEYISNIIKIFLGEIPWIKTMGCETPWMREIKCAIKTYHGCYREKFLWIRVPQQTSLTPEINLFQYAIEIKCLTLKDQTSHLILDGWIRSLLRFPEINLFQYAIEIKFLTLKDQTSYLIPDGWRSRSSLSFPIFSLNWYNTSSTTSKQYKHTIYHGVRSIIAYIINNVKAFDIFQWIQYSIKYTSLHKER